MLLTQHLDDDVCADEEAAFATDLTWWCCFRDPNLEAQYRRQRVASKRKARVLIAGILSLAALAKVALSTMLIGLVWTSFAASALCLVLSHVFASKSFEAWHHDTQSDVLTVWLAMFAAFQPVQLDYRLAQLLGGENSRHLLAGKGECEVNDAALCIRTCVLLALLLVQDLDLKRYAIIVATSLCSQLFWQAQPSLPDTSATRASTMAVHVMVVAIIMLAKAHMNVTSRVSFHHRISVREHSREHANEVLKASVAEAARLARSRLIRVVRAMRRPAHTSLRQSRERRHELMEDRRCVLLSARTSRAAPSHLTRDFFSQNSIPFTPSLSGHARPSVPTARDEQCG